jgi:hypothetical protein
MLAAPRWTPPAAGPLTSPVTTYSYDLVAGFAMSKKTGTWILRSRWERHR